MLPLCFFECFLRLGAGSLTPLAFLLPGALFLPALAFSQPFGSLVLQGSTAGPSCRRPCPAVAFFGIPRDFARLWSVSLPESRGRSACSLKGPSDPTRRFRVIPGFDMVAATRPAVQLESFSSAEPGGYRRSPEAGSTAAKSVAAYASGPMATPLKSSAGIRSLRCRNTDLFGVKLPQLIRGLR
jgi:hypothetical protein